MIRITLEELVEGIINREHGWAVAEQFRDTFSEGEEFHEQNGNALVRIRMTIASLLASKLLNEKAQEDLQDYFDDLEDFIVKEGC